uniref:Uncharacterized protein n=1 Tax=Leersia perrieri TaxID=77586 RepID=A0A0D9VCS9_9ORYZ
MKTTAEGPSLHSPRAEQSKAKGRGPNRKTPQPQGAKRENSQEDDTNDLFLSLSSSLSHSSRRLCSGRSPEKQKGGERSKQSTRNPSPFSLGFPPPPPSSPAAAARGASAAAAAVVCVVGASISWLPAAEVAGERARAFLV